ncbi:hypothetical protein AX16_000180 [Volvariella volvacea WC 439]|nr:hypothetical protein AX16_000180 [Volvariella volvacea WC 439]
MSSHELIDAQFDRAVEIVQGLPKTGPIQTDYEEKLTMYSLYKQATVGNVKPPRPGIWDMLGRAKWDAWAKHKDLDPYEAKWLYVDALIKVLRKYPGDANAMELLQELESFGGDPANLVTSRTFTRTPGSESSGSTVSEGRAPHPYSRAGPSRQLGHEEGEEDENSSEDEVSEGPSPLGLPLERVPSQMTRPQSSLSSQHRYRTPMAGSLAMSPPPPPTSQPVPAAQPLPSFETPSAFAEDTPLSPPGSYPTTSSYVAQFSESSRAELTSPNLYSNYAQRNVPLQTHPYQQYNHGRPASVPSIERAVESVQAHLAALTERIENLESAASHSRTAGSSSSPRRSAGSPGWGGNRGSLITSGRQEWDIDDLGMWSVVLHPLSRVVNMLQDLALFFARDESRSPSQVIVRRLVLDASFLVFAVGLVRFLWRRSGVRRREVKAALIVLWRAILGVQPQRTLTDRGV